MQTFITALSVLMGVVVAALMAANVSVIVATKLHHRQEIMRFLSHFSRVVMHLRLSDSVSPSKPYRH